MTRNPDIEASVTIQRESLPWVNMGLKRKKADLFTYPMPEDVNATHWQKRKWWYILPVLIVVLFWLMWWVANDLM